MASASPPVEATELLKATQGDILAGGILKKHEKFIFFSIEKPGDFCQRLHLAMVTGLFSSGNFVVQRRAYATTFRAAQREHDTEVPFLLPMAVAQISFSAIGLAKMQEALSTDLGLTNTWKKRDPAFFDGMEADAKELMDPMNQWEDGFKGGKIHGLFLVAGSDNVSVDEVVEGILYTFTDSLSVIHREVGQVRKGESEGREHFGFKDGISQPTVQGFGPDNAKVPDGVVGELGAKWNTFPQSTFVIQTPEGDDRPEWTKYGSFQVFRKLEQDVKKWNEDIEADAKRRGISPTLLAAKIVGRWQSGCPVMVSTSKDDKSQQLNNQFDFMEIPRNNSTDALCPGGSHIRKMNPHRAVTHDDGGAHPEGRIIRRAIPYGTEYDNGKGEGPRGLHFVCYQSSIDLGFRNIQMSWANSIEFPVSASGVDALMGNQLQDGESKMSISDDDKKKKWSHFVFKGFNPYVKARGGEYFFVPSFTALKEVLSIPPPARS